MKPKQLLMCFFTWNRVFTFFVLFFLLTVHLPAQVISTIAGTDSIGYNGDSIPAITAKLSSPYGVAIDSNGDIYISDEFLIRKIDATTGIITRYAGLDQNGGG